METIFDNKTLDNLIKRAENINDSSQAKWGKMDAYQMLLHCTKNAKLLQTKKNYKRLFMGKIFGKLALKATLKNNKQMSKNSPTHPEFVIKETGSVNSIKATFIEALIEYKNVNENEYEKFVHPFFGKMNADQVGRWEYKHLDHHLRQFNA